MEFFLAMPLVAAEIQLLIEQKERKAEKKKQLKNHRGKEKEIEKTMIIVVTMTIK